MELFFINLRMSILSVSNAKEVIISSVVLLVRRKEAPFFNAF